MSDGAWAGRVTGNDCILGSLEARVASEYGKARFRRLALLPGGGSRRDLSRGPQKRVIKVLPQHPLGLGEAAQAWHCSCTLTCTEGALSKCTGVRAKPAGRLRWLPHSLQSLSGERRKWD